MPPASGPTARYVLDGRRLSSLDAFWDAYLAAVGAPNRSEFGRNLDAFADSLAGGPGGPPLPATFVIQHAASARRQLGHAQTAQALERRLERAAPENRPAIAAQLAAARQGEGPTVFDWLIDILRQAKGLTLELEDDAG